MSRAREFHDFEISEPEGLRTRRDLVISRHQLSSTMKENESELKVLSGGLAVAVGNLLVLDAFGGVTRGTCGRCRASTKECVSTKESVSRKMLARHRDLRNKPAPRGAAFCVWFGRPLARIVSWRILDPGQGARGRRAWLAELRRQIGHASNGSTFIQ